MSGRAIMAAVGPFNPLHHSIGGHVQRKQSKRAVKGQLR